MNMKKLSIFLTILLISMLHYLTPIELHNFHAVYQRLYYVPVILCSYWFGLRWGLAASAFSAIVYIPHIILQWTHMPMERFTQYVEIVMLLVIGFFCQFFIRNPEDAAETDRRGSSIDAANG